MTIPTYAISVLQMQIFIQKNRVCTIVVLILNLIGLLSPFKIRTLFLFVRLIFFDILNSNSYGKYYNLKKKKKCLNAFMLKN